MDNRSADRFKVPRLKPGYGFAGPEYAGCCNTGARIVILRQISSKRYLVGKQSSVDNMDSRAYLLFHPTRRKHNGIWTFKTRTPAVKKFHELNQQVLDYNADIRRKHAELQEAKKRGDLEAVNRLALELA